jgi:predicted TIM-barrel fold metal-dependent hydrolase
MCRRLGGILTEWLAFDGKASKLEEERTIAPKSTLESPVHLIGRAKFPVVDMHNHSQWDGVWQVTDIPALLQVMDAVGVAGRVDLDGGTGDRLQQHLNLFRRSRPDRFAVFASCDWTYYLQFEDFAGQFARDFADGIRQGAEGLKLWKELGLTVKDRDGRRIATNDPRLQPIWDVAAEYGVPVLIHTADPVAFFQPLEGNELYHSLMRHPDWHFYGSGYPPFEQLMQEFEEVLVHNPSTTFIGAHVGNYAENLSRVGQWLDQYPNFYVDIAARISQLGRQPYTARRFLTRYSRRVVFGLDKWPTPPDNYQVMFRFLETEDEYFDYVTMQDLSEGASAAWKIYGVGLADDVLEDIYYRTALTLLPRFKNDLGWAF